ncbi:hypothetical protein CHLNCDRAFT_144148 [Chlorella variabilis]|uniref:Exostosin GT47 domain-containing protein n=1 Tax=Chlorella variabilis TaxID=554065 RepID=E1ZC08_CHLVA|nr:hypothetical protein CHLNCDRAFT_144148 [Chlorella variabilis]EFN56525.1 hypothetical protein CHLNCDRAFT_144148 [Chlorella variabilis]|eukprot:XP_005848627.1 hypothetical protein CHLNCDRAFT_144148 [Chlorella variabilis]
MEGFSLPATPSKAKPGRRGFCSLTTLLVVFALVAGVAMFNQELGGSSSRTETYYRKALVAKMYFGDNGQTVTATSEEYSRSTVAGGGAGAAKAKATAAAKAAAGRAEPRAALELDEEEEEWEEGGGGGGGAAEAAADEDEFSSLEDEDEDAHPSSEQQQQQQQRLVTTTVKATATSDAPLTVTISATQEMEGATAAAAAAAADEQGEEATSTTTTTTTITTTQPAAAAGTGAGAAQAAQQPAATAQQQQQQQQGAAGPEQEDPAEAAASWWSDVVDPSGERLPKAARRERDISASLATAVVFDESAVPDNPDCKIAVMDVDQRWGEVYGAGNCDLADEKLWPFASMGRGIDGHNLLLPEQYQYSMEHWITKAIRNSSRYTDDTAAADFVFVDMGCYHTSWMAWLHPQNEEGRKLVPSPEYYIKRSFTKLRGMARCVQAAWQGACLGRRRRAGCRLAGFRETKGGDFGMVHPAPLMKGLFTEEAACEDFASVLNMVPERASLCVWTQDSHTQGKSVLLPYAAVSDIDMDVSCIPVFVGAPFHTLPLAGDVDYASFALFVNVTDTSAWVNTSSPKWEHNHMISKAWKLDDRSAEEGMVTVPRLADLVTLLRGMPAEEVAARHAGVVAHRLKFWYPPASAQAIATSVAAAGAASAAGAGIATSGALLQGGRGGGGGGGAGTGAAGARVLREGAAAAEALQGQLAAARAGHSVLGELLMRKMCHRAAAVQKRLAEAAQLGLDYQDSDEKVEHPSLAQQATPEEEEEEEADEAGMKLSKRLSKRA